jgi:hypothetical protein
MILARPSHPAPMNLQSLKHHIERAEVRQRIVGGYAGAQSLGIGLDPETGALAFILRVEAATACGFPTSVALDDDAVRIVVVPAFAEPHVQGDPEADSRR